MKAIGPQNAVVIAVNIPVTNSNKLRTRMVLIPKFSAYLSPNSKAFNGLIKRHEPMSPNMVMVAKKESCDNETPPKDPIPQTIYERTPSSVAKKLRRDMAEDDR